MHAALLLLLVAASDTNFAEPVAWKPLFQGVEITNLRADSPRLMRGHAVRIGLQTPGVSFLATPGNGDTKLDTDGLKTSSFLAKHRCQLAINAAPFSPIHKEEGLPQTVVGLTVSRGQVVSKADKTHPSLLLTKWFVPQMRVGFVTLGIPKIEWVWAWPGSCLPDAARDRRGRTW